MFPVTPYIWQYQPQTGETAGARQDYGSVINWLSSSPYLYERLAALNRERNEIDKERAKFRGVPVTRNNPTPGLHGTGYSLNDGRQYRKLSRDALPFPHGWQVFEDGMWKPVPTEINGTGNALSSYPTVVISDYRQVQSGMRGGMASDNGIPTTLLTEPSNVGKINGMDPVEFIGRFPPVVYNDPFSEPTYFFPKEFSPLWDPNKDFRASSALTMKYRNVY